MSSTPDSWQNWTDEEKVRLLIRARWQVWARKHARPEQLPPAGEWRTWYLQGGRGSGKTRSAAETLAHWIDEYGPGDWGMVFPTFGDARDVGAEGESGILQALGGYPGPFVENWNRSLGEIFLVDGSRIYLDGANDGAYRVQGKNLRACWCDEVGLWEGKWERAWNESIPFAVRHHPARIIATGTPKMGHPLVKLLVEDEKVPISRLRMIDNVANLSREAVYDFIEKYGDSVLGKQELDGEWIDQIEGDLLKRKWWRYYDPRLLGTVGDGVPNVERLPAFSMILCSIDTPLKDKESSDNVAIQLWGVKGADRYLLDARCDRMSYGQALRTSKEMSLWAREHWPFAQHRVLIENAGYGVEMILDLKRELTGVEKISPGAEGNKGQRAFAAAADLESGNCFLPGYQNPDLSGPAEHSPKMTLSLIEEAAMFQIDGSHTGHDDQVDAWSQAINYIRARPTMPMQTARLT